MIRKKILIYGAGPLGSLLAVKFQEGGNEVSLLARGKRLTDLREHGIILRDYFTKKETVTKVNIVEQLAPDDAYDLVMVVMRKNYALDILPILAENQHTPNVLFLMNNMAGPDKMVDALGADRVLIGFPAAAGFFEDQVIQYLAGTEDEPKLIPFGEVDGRIIERTKEVARILDSAEGFGAEIRNDMDAWLKSHVAFLVPGLAGALYAADTDNHRLARTRDALVLAARAIRESLKVLKALKVEIVPAKYKIFLWLPEPILVKLLRRFVSDEVMETAMVGHASAARNEKQFIVDEFLTLARTTSVSTPAIDRLYPYFDPETPLIPDCSEEIPLRWI